ncbi:MAG TPA: hypothetical protein VER83_07640 [Candidatus Nanopelagicales bacterium]|nr:hypothetical protein [Candidatus Nanopelagicales bacterium]
MDGRRAAAENNAALCDAVWRSHGLPTVHERDVWATAARAPDLYPDAVTLEPGVAAGRILARIDASSGCSIKDSFADLDLRPFGFEILFDAEWYERDPGLAEPARDPWTVVESPSGLAAWAGAHGGGAVFRPALLADPAVRVLIRHVRGGGIEGAIANDGGGVIGVSNVFAPGAPDGGWDGLVEAIGALFPGRTLVGYGAGEDLRAAHREGFRSIGPLRVWVRR